MSCNKINSAVITPVLAAGSVASPYYFSGEHFSKTMLASLRRSHSSIFTGLFS